jgi:NIMA (never in mitosis gene a)-related kinase
MENFKITSKIGKGAYSTVYTVINIKDNNLYALKKVNLRNLSKKEIQNALNEVRILALVQSKNIISYKESFIDETDSTLCIIMEYADEGDLQKKITLYKKLKKSFLENDIWRIFIQITKGLKDLHDFNILHRDLKSANIFYLKMVQLKLVI